LGKVEIFGNVFGNWLKKNKQLHIFAGFKVRRKKPVGTFTPDIKGGLVLRYATRATHATWEFELKFRIEYFIKPQQNNLRLQRNCIFFLVFIWIFLLSKNILLRFLHHFEDLAELILNIYILFWFYKIFNTKF